ncbi:hypothetical protein SO694_00064145 [Aureococcus anophagefferens]|uniref:Uncharacterized protein n=1 Tax=Aureococcus anophagefferens TaxID=44056 RepID=A0ABR1FQL6_AURAN
MSLGAPYDFGARADAEGALAYAAVFAAPVDARRSRVMLVALAALFAACVVAAALTDVSGAPRAAAGLRAPLLRRGIALGNSLEFPDPGCDGFRTERACLDRQTPFHARRDACVWGACGRSCAFHEPGADGVSSVASTVCLAIALGLLVPVIQAFGVLFDRYLAAPYPAALRWHCCGGDAPDRPGALRALAGSGRRIRRFPFETKLPSLSTFFVASWHDELRHTAIGRHCLGEARLEERGAAAAPVAGAKPDEGWRPSLPTEVAIFLISFVIVLPSELQQALFEELVLFVWGAATAIAIALEPRIGHEGRAHFDDADAGAGPDKDVV